jgi:hypothetical protein
MKRFIFLLLILLMAAGCSSGSKDRPGNLNREAILPNELISSIACIPMKLAYDNRDERNGVVRWAWEETEGLPRLLSVQIYFPPAQCDELYDEAEAQKGCSAMSAPDHVQVCYDGRAAHMRFGSYYVKIAILGFPEEKGAVDIIAEELVSSMMPEQ